MYLLLLGVQLQVPDPKEEKPVPEGHPISKPQPVPARTSLPLPLPAKGGWRLAVTWLWERRDWRGFGVGEGSGGKAREGAEAKADSRAPGPVQPQTSHGLPATRFLSRI